ncbi:uncharacterized protein LOC128777773 [Panthera pardus]|uniref:Uncharacterized protein LOC128777773 n=1 Tax=Panthera pardus TaxID=9691 RepID=A0A9W2VRJ1_PANPR|nr:uncharacterized protein LOC128777773 [Panthera pardus]
MLPARRLRREPATASFSAAASAWRSRCPAPGAPAPRSSSSSSSSAAREKQSCCRPASQPSLGNWELSQGPAPPGPAVPAGATSPPSWPPSGPGSPTSELAGGCRPATRALQPSRCLAWGSRGGNVASRQPQPASNRKFMWLPGRPDFALGPGHHTQLSPQRPRERAPRGGVS